MNNAISGKPNEPTRVLIERLRDSILSRKIAHADELQLQSEVFEILRADGFQLDREKQLGPKDRVDFWLPDHLVGVECKIKGSATGVVSQLMRYAEHPDVAGLLLVSSSRRIAARCPSELMGKPCGIVVVRGSLF